MSKEIYTVQIVSSIVINTPKGSHLSDTVQTYFDVTWGQTLAYRAKFPTASITIEKQTRVTGKTPTVQVGESPMPAPRAPIDPNKFYDVGSTKPRINLNDHSRYPYERPIDQSHPFKRNTRNTLDREPGTNVREEVSIGYGDVVNAIMKESAA